MIEKGASLHDLKKGFEEFPQVELNIRVKEKKPLEKLPELRKTVEGVEKALKNKGRVVVRYSGTEMLLRIMVEGKSYDAVKNYANEIGEVARKYLSEVGHA
jgi:phosphoglucosamine mutase